jgi:hypothetical protein
MKDHTYVYGNILFLLILLDKKVCNSGQGQGAANKNNNITREAGPTNTALANPDFCCICCSWRAFYIEVK